MNRGWEYAVVELAEEIGTLPQVNVTILLRVVQGNQLKNIVFINNYYADGRKTY